MEYEVSIIIPVYNVQFTIENCFLSLQNQTIGFENLEIIFVDDCSTDKSQDIIRAYEKKYENVKAYFSKENSGIAGKPRNIGLNLATANYVMFLDPDDTFNIDACEVLYNKIEETNADIVSGFHSIKTRYNNKEEVFPGLIRNTFTDPKKSMDERNNDVNEFIAKYPEEIYIKSIDDMPSILGNFGLSSKIFRLDVIHSNDISFPEYIPGEDSTFLLNALLCANGIVFVNKLIYSYTTFRNDEGNESVSFQVDIDKNLGRIKAYKLMLDISRKYNKVYEYVHYILHGKLKYFLQSFIIKPEYIPKNDIKLIFKEGYTLFNEVKKGDIELSTNYDKIVTNIVEGNYDRAIELCNELKKVPKNSNGKKSIPFIKDINVAVIMDPFTYNSYSNEFNAIAVEPCNWREKFETENIDLFFCESAFHGISDRNIVNGVAIEDRTYIPWGGKLGINLIHGWDSREPLFEILDYCKEHNIPTIFWNKEDPTSFDNPSYNFIDTALKFDYVFTTDEDIIPRYNARGHNNVYPLLFASQIKLFNPIKTNERSNEVIFAGSWYNQFPDRCKAMRSIFDKILDSNYGLKIYNRESKTTADNRKYPNEYGPFIYPGVSFDKMPLVYKESNFALNINTVTNSHTMFARRVFELMSSNTFVISNYSVGIHELFKDNVLYLDYENSLNIDESKLDKIREENLYNVLQNHTYTNRFKYILNTIGFEFMEVIDKVNIIYIIESVKQLEDIVKDFDSMNYSHKKCIIVSKNKDIQNDLSDKIDDNITILDYNHLYYLSENFTDNDYFIFRDLNEKINEDFLKKALLHYQYLDNTTGIIENDEKYVFNKTHEYSNILFNNVKFDSVIEILLNNRINKLTVYNI